jgi:tetratricopeptide (TPR) repeat protein
VFNVTFPPGKDVAIEVAYTVNGFGYYPYEAFRYILETGAGWKDTIGSADIIVRLPYEATEYNVWLPDGTTGYSSTTAGAVLNGNEVRWHFESLEPTWQNNIEVSLVTPGLWQTVLKETSAVTKDPNDGEAWGRLGKGYKEIVRMSKGYLRDDPAGREIYGLSKQAYEKCLSLLPDDSLWHYGYADLLWSHYLYDYYWMNLPDSEGLLPLTLTELKTALELDPNNELAKDLLRWISDTVPGSVKANGPSYDYLALTATPLPPTPFIFATETLISAPTEMISTPTAQPVPSNTESPVATEEPGPSPVPSCGGAALILPALFGVLLLSRRMIR